MKFHFSFAYAVLKRHNFGKTRLHGVQIANGAVAEINRNIDPGIFKVEATATPTQFFGYVRGCCKQVSPQRFDDTALGDGIVERPCLSQPRDT